MTSAKSLMVQNIMDLLNILVVDDEPNILRDFEDFPEGRGTRGDGCE
jgi:hypothetical protein